MMGTSEAALEAMTEIAAFMGETLVGLSEPERQDVRDVIRRMCAEDIADSDYRWDRLGGEWVEKEDEDDDEPEKTRD